LEDPADSRLDDPYLHLIDVFEPSNLKTFIQEEGDKLPLMFDGKRKVNVGERRCVKKRGEEGGGERRRRREERGKKLLVIDVFEPSNLKAFVQEEGDKLPLMFEGRGRLTWEKGGV
jgi:hypothetical protein